MKSYFQILKMRAAVLYVLLEFKDGVDFIKLFKILYFAQQEHLVKYGRGVIGDTFHALRHGPVPAFIYKAVQVAQGKIEDSKDFDLFLKGIQVSDKSLISSKEVPDRDELSQSDMDCLTASISKYKDIEPYDLSELSHDSAWNEANKRTKEDPEKDIMTLLDIAKAGNAPEGMIEYIKDSILFDNWANGKGKALKRGGISRTLDRIGLDSDYAIY